MDAPATWEQLIDAVRAYSAWPTHRTGSLEHRETLAWLAGRLRALGLAPQMDAFTIPGFRVRTVRLEIDGANVPADAYYYSGATGPTGVAGTLVGIGAEDLTGKIAVAHVPFAANFLAPALDDAMARAHTCGAAALLAITDGLSEHRVQKNVTPSAEPRGVPTLLVGPDDADAFLRRVGAGQARVRLDAAFAPIETHNLSAEIRGAGKRTLVIWTPVTGWYACAAERGPGVAVLLALAGRFARMPEGERPARVLLAFTGGHELHHAGFEAWLDAQEAVLDGARFVHLGATLAAAVEHRTRLFVRYPEPLRSRLAAVARKAGLDVDFAPDDAPLLGEQRNVVERGWPVLSYSGGHALFHTPADVPDATVDADAHSLERAAGAIARQVELLASE